MVPAAPGEPLFSIKLATDHPHPDFHQPEKTRLREEVMDALEWVELGALNKLIDLLKKLGLNQVAMVGRVPHQSVLQYRHFDGRMLKLLASAINKKADTLLEILCRELATEVEMVHGHYGEFKVLVDGETVIDAGAMAFLGVLPSGKKVVEAVQARLAG